MARRPYHIARQEHLGDMLDELKARGQLDWQWDYDQQGRRAIFNVCVRNGQWEALETRAAERIVQALCDELAIPWRPVPHPGGEAQRILAIESSKRDEPPGAL